MSNDTKNILLQVKHMLLARAAELRLRGSYVEAADEVGQLADIVDVHVEAELGFEASRAMSRQPKRRSRR